ncbi:MAG: PH domain-containing protein [Candidatus Portnoybacteria bacterium]|nr:PH domain-containing protein [Candidatus Portnoybacteria bacterium]
MFFELKPDEKIIATLRRHWLVLSLVILRVLPLLFLPFILKLLLLFVDLPSNPLIDELFWLASSIWWLFVWTGLAVIWINYYLDYWIITNQRIISTYQKGLFRREVSELSFTRIQDITANVGGIIKTFFNYGSLEVRTAGTFETGQESNVFVLEDIPRPYEIQNTLSKIHHDFIRDFHHRL